MDLQKESHVLNSKHPHPSHSAHLPLSLKILQWSAGISPSRRLHFYKVSLVCGYLPRSALSLFPQGQPGGFGAGLLTPTGFAAHTKLCLPITRCTGRQDSSPVPWCMVLHPTTFMEALLYVNGCLISCFFLKEQKGRTYYVTMVLMSLQNFSCTFKCLPHKMMFPILPPPQGQTLSKV